MTELDAEKIMPIMIDTLRRMTDKIPMLFSRKEFVAELNCVLMSGDRELCDTSIDWWFKELIAQQFVRVDMRETYRRGMHVYELDTLLLNDVVGPSVDSVIVKRKVLAMERKKRKCEREGADNDG